MTTKNSLRKTPVRYGLHATIILTLIILAMASFSNRQPVQAQAFSSGSTGADGALDFSSATPGTTIEFNPASFNPPLDPERDNIYHFTTITIPTGVTVRLTAKFLDGPVYWLATGDVLINGTIDLSGGNGHLITNQPLQRIPSTPGAGGFAGGIGGHFSSTRPSSPQRGNGPAGGGPGSTCCESNGGGGGFSGNRFLVPLVGGSGGGGGNTGGPDVWGGGGGAGGGALLIASSTSINVNGHIAANGGGGQNVNSCCSTGGGGSGGAIQLVANRITGTGSLSARGGTNNVRSAGGGGFIRLEAFVNQFSQNFNGTGFALASPSSLFLPSTAAPSVRAVRIAGIPVPTTLSGSFEVPDVVINQGGAATVEIEAKFVPLGTVVKVHVFSENEGDQIVDSTPLQGTLAQATATASVVFPSGFSRGFVRAVWRP